ncbi:MAG TPA: hypothetical protein DG754_13650 [Bacteroidales bacterium]|nr:hypothetical protein [Bacteroidales bacterium]
MDNDDNKFDNEELKDENLFFKMKLMAEYGAYFSGPDGGSKVSPEIENQFLKNIEEFEKQFHSGKRVTISQRLKNPVFEKEDSIPDDKISEALKNVRNLLNENSISLDALCDVTDRELYRFIMEELIHQEVDDVNMPGMMSCFIYEEFYPNQEHNIGNDCSNFFHFFLTKEYNFYAHHLAENLKGESYLKHFSDSFTSFEKLDFAITSINIEGEKAHVHFTADFIGTIDITQQKQRFCGSGEMELTFDGEYWYIERVVLPKKVDDF